MPITESVNVHEEGVTAAVIIRDTPTGGLDADIKGYMAPLKLVYFLREIADHIEQNGPVNG